MLVVGVVAAQLCAARCRINLHLPARPKVQLKLFQRSTVACPLPTDLLRRIAIQCPELIVPFARRDFISELRTVCHNDSSLNMLLWDRWVCYVYCNASNRFFQFPTLKKREFWHPVQRIRCTFVEFAGRCVVYYTKDRAQSCPQRDRAEETRLWQMYISNPSNKIIPIILSFPSSIAASNAVLRAKHGGRVSAIIT